jgi:hypothetical protein
MRRAVRTLVLLAFACGLSACDKEPTKLEQMTQSASASAASPTTSTAAAPTATAPSKPQLAVDDAAAYVSGERFDLAQPDPKGRLVAALSTKPVAGETITLEATRDAHTPKVATVFGALAATKAKGVLVRTRRRDGVTAEIAFVIGSKREGCTAVGYIAKDGAINAWTAAGTKALRFTRGMAGPDLTRGSEGVRKLIASCDASSWAVAADDSVTWGLVVDLVLAVSFAEDGGTPARNGSARDVSLVGKAVPGQPVGDAD